MPVAVTERECPGTFMECLNEHGGVCFHTPHLTQLPTPSSLLPLYHRALLDSPKGMW